jgi:trigger factor
MVQKNISKHPKAITEVTVTMPWSDLSPKWEEVLNRMLQDLEVPGFRKGQVPPEMAGQYLGKKLEDEVLRTVMPQALIEALQGTDVVPIDYPQYQVISFQKGGDLQFRATITERPAIKVGEYKGIKVQRPVQKEVKEEEVNKIIDDLYQRWRVKNPNQPPAAQPVNQGVSGSLSFGAAAPAQPAQPVANTEDSPNDTFAQAMGATSLIDLKTKIKQDLEAEAKYNNELDYEEAILQEVEKMTQVDIPDILIQDELNRMLVSLQRTVSDRGMLMEEYLKTQGKTQDQLKNEWRPQAEKNVKMELGLSEIAKNENVNITDDELQAEVDKIQDQRVKAQFTQQEPRMHLRHALRQTKTLNLLKTIVG